MEESKSNLIKELETLKNQKQKSELPKSLNRRAHNSDRLTTCKRPSKIKLSVKEIAESQAPYIKRPTNAKYVKRPTNAKYVKG